MRRRQALALGLAPLMAAPALAQPAAWPNKPIRLVIPWPPGQQTDVVSRLVGDWLSRRLGQAVVPENRGGAGGMIGTDMAAKAAPDGYTLLGASIGPITFGPLVNRPPYDVDRELATVASFGRGPYMLVVRPDFPAASAAAFVAALKAQPGKYTYASSGIGGAQHLLGAMFLARAGLEALHIPFQGSAAAMTALMAGQVDFGMETPAAAAALVRDGKLRALGQSLGRPSALAPGLPPLSEAASVPDFDVGGWNGLMAPMGTPQPIVERLAAEVKAAFEVPEMRERLALAGLEAAPLGPEAYRAMLHRLRDEFGPVIRRLGIRAE